MQNAKEKQKKSKGKAKEAAASTFEQTKYFWNVIYEIKAGVKARM